MKNGRIIEPIEITEKYWKRLYNQNIFTIKEIQKFWEKIIVPRISIIGSDYDNKVIGIVAIKYGDKTDRLVVYMTPRKDKKGYVYNSIYSEATQHIQGRYWLTIYDTYPGNFWNEKEEYQKLCNELSRIYKLPREIVFELKCNEEYIKTFIKVLKEAFDMFLMFDDDYMQRLASDDIKEYSKALDEIKINVHTKRMRRYVYACINNGKIHKNYPKQYDYI